MLYDEYFHVNVIKLFSQQLSPFITSQPTSYDIFGVLSYGVATLFHYLMSFPYRAISVFTDNLAIQVISMRLVCIAFTAVGIVLFNKLFQKIGIKQVFINVALLLFVLLPIVPFVAATVNYDNMLFPLTALFFIICVDILSSKKIVWTQYAWFIIIGCFASLVKYTFLPIFAVSTIYLAVVLYKQYGRGIFFKAIESFQATTKQVAIGLAGLIIVAVGMFSVVYIQNIILFGALQPNCQKVMSQERCDDNSLLVRDEQAEATKDTRPLIQTPDYVSLWFVQMADWTTMSGARTVAYGTVVGEPLPVIYSVVFFGGFIGLLSMIYSWNFLDKNKNWYFLLVVSLILVLAVFMQNYAYYIRLHAAYTIQPRYLLTIMPILIVMTVVAVNYIVRKRNTIKLLILFCALVLFLQGGGLITHIICSDEGWNWDSHIVRQINNSTRDFLTHL